jgi:predicted nuclease with TOPRIM domain
MKRPRRNQTMAEGDERRGYAEGGRLVPIPDPTLLTTAQLDREIRNLETRIQSDLKSVNEHVEAIKQIDQGHFERIQIQFSERDKQTSLALQGQKELTQITTEYINTTVAKMDASYTKLFDQMQVLLSNMTKNVDEKFIDIKSRIDRIEAGKGRVDVMQIFSAAASIASIVTVFYVLLTRHV